MTPVRRLLAAITAVWLAAGCGSEPPGPSNAEPARRVVADPPAVVVAPPPDRPVARPEPDRPTAPEQSAETVYRPDDARPRHDDALLERLGIHWYASRRLVLYSDVPAERVARLPPLVDSLYAALSAYFGDLPPARDGSDYQLTGYLIGDFDLFRSAKLVPEGLTLRHGRHLGQEFWLRDQEFDYYRAHLLLHEATHCFMTALPGSDEAGVWYMEGMAERFGTHRAAGGDVAFGVMPVSPEESAGSGRITLVREDVAGGAFKTLDAVVALRPERFSEDASYAWSWAACTFLDSHPRYRDRFRQLGDPRLRPRFDEEFRSRFGPDLADLAVEWAHFAHTLRYGYDIERAAIAFQAGTKIAAGSPANTTVAADRGWQSAGVRVEAGKRYAVAADGRFTLADGPKPWTSDAGGITFDYFDGRPLGKLLAAVLAEESVSAPDPARGLLSPIDIGLEASFVAPSDGTIYFRVNDGWDRLHDNRGELQVTIQSSE